MNDQYDCTQDVLDHKDKVEYWMHDFSIQINNRARIHDDSKLNDPVEKQLFDHWTPKLREIVFGSDEYKVALVGMGEGVERHYKANRHHPEHYENGVNDMTLIDIVEMLSDWIAAAQRKNTYVDLSSAAKRFGLSEQLVKILANTLRENDCWNLVSDVHVPAFCPSEYAKGHVEGFERQLSDE